MPVEVLLLLALPASGKSELRRYLAHLPADVARRDFDLGPQVQVDDYPYVHLMRRISQEQRRLGMEPAFFLEDDTPFRHPADWLTLIHLLAADVESLGVAQSHDPAPEGLIRRIERARDRAGLGAATIAAGAEVLDGIAAEAAHLAAALPVVAPQALAAATIVVEFSRGGPDGAHPPLPHPLGYAASLAALGPGILERASILWVVADPAESRRRNRERARPGRDGDASTLHHGVPETVMLHDYGMDDLGWLSQTSPVPGTIAIPDGDWQALLPIARFDNRVDRTSFLRSDPDSWPPDLVAPLHQDLVAAFATLATGPAPA
ncbi:MAG: hypothetical protein A2135_09900 [Actinobacteria bacterium RBG_16_67_15]|nr:MAG: hypothetical protein A2135_09900 [Actinobacteria bacterium RBG_16_67_15]